LSDKPTTILRSNFLNSTFSSYFKQIKIQKSSENSTTIKPMFGKENSNSTYLITGGLGGLGFGIANWMIKEKGINNLVLISRNISNISNEIQNEIEKLKSIRKEITIKIMKGDVINFEEMKKIIEEIKSTMPPICGVIHSAFVLEDST